MMRFQHQPHPDGEKAGSVRMAFGKACLVAALVFAWLPGAAPACACGEFKGVVVAHGTSPGGEPWRIKATGPTVGRAGNRSVEFYFSTGSLEGYDKVGLFKGMSLPISKRFVLSANAGSNVLGENSLGGVAGRRAVTLVIGLSSGERLRVAPTLAPEELRLRFPWLQRLRFFKSFSGDASPLWVKAFDHRGRPLGGAKSDRGGFWAFDKSGAPGAPLWDRKFVATSIRARGGELWPQERARKLHLSFAWIQSQWIGWEAGCNAFGAKVRVTRTRIEKIGAIIGTAKGCRPARQREDSWLLRFFQGNPRWHWRNGRLTLWSNGNVIVLTTKLRGKR